MSVTISTNKFSHFFDEYDLNALLRNVSINDFETVALIDMAIIYTDDIDLNLLKKKFKKISNSRNPAREDVGVYHHKTKKHLGLPLEIVIEKDKMTMLFGKLKKYTLRINPSRFKNFNSFIEVFNAINKDSNYVLGRVDFTLLLPKEYFTLEALAKSIFIKGKTGSVHFYEARYADMGHSPHSRYSSGQMTGFQLGAYPDRLSVYDASVYKNKEKAKQIFYEHYLSGRYSKICGYHKEFLSKYGDQVIVFERQMHSSVLKKYQLTRLDQLVFCNTLEPFGHIEFMDWNLDFDCLKRSRSREKVSRFVFECAIRGYHQARSAFNSTRNFKRMECEFKPTISFIEGIEFSTFINESFRDGVLKYFSLEGVEIFKKMLLIKQQEK